MTKRSDRKAIIRKCIKEAITRLSPESKKRADEKIKDALFSRRGLIGAKSICIYVSRPDEVDTREIIAGLFKRNKTLIVPRITGDHVTLRQIHSFDDLEEGKFHILEPNESCPRVDPSSVDLFIVPGIAFDRQGHRLGRGVGYYDKLLTGVTVPKIGLAYACQVIAQVPVTSYDVSVTALVTEGEQ